MTDAHAVSRHVVHEEIAEVFCGNDDQRLRTGVFNLLALCIEIRVELVALFDILNQIRTPGDAGRMAEYSCIDQAHRCFSSSVKLVPPPVIV